jgi:hypothetical protein
VAFQYKVHPQGERKSCVVNEEASGFVFPDRNTTFLCPQSKPMVGFARTMPSYETSIYRSMLQWVQNGSENNGFTFPCLFKVNNNGWVLISETGVDSRYCAQSVDWAMPTVCTPLDTPWKAKTTETELRLRAFRCRATRLGAPLPWAKRWLPLLKQPWLSMWLNRFTKHRKSTNTPKARGVGL